MRVLIDECIDPRVKLLFDGQIAHQVSTVHEQGWGALEDGPLLAVAQDEFDVLLTIDRGLEYQQNLSKLRMGVVVAHVPKNQLDQYSALLKELVNAIETAQPGRVIVGVGHAQPALLQ